MAATPLGIEALAVVSGPLRLLEEKCKPITRQVLEKAADVEPGIAKAVRAFLDLEKPEPQGDEPEEHDYDDTLKKLTTKRSEQEELYRRSHVCSQLPDPMVAGDYSKFFDRLKGFLLSVFPRRSYVTLTGQQQAEPSLLELSPFWRAWEAAADPRVLFRDMREAILVSDQVVVVQQLYPMLYAVMTQQMLIAMGERKAKDKEYEPAGWQEQQIETLLQISRVSPDLAAELQARASQQTTNEDAQEQGPAGVNVGDKAIDSLQTPTQRQALR